MNKKWQLTRLFSLTLALLFSFSFSSCNTSDDSLSDASNTEKRIMGLSAEELAKNETFIAYVKASDEFLQGFHRWKASLSEEDRIAYEAKVKQALEDRDAEALLPPHLSAQEYEAYNVAQKERHDKVMQMFPELAKMETLQASKLRQEASDIVLGKGSGLKKLKDYEIVFERCHRAYNECSWAAYDAGQSTHPCWVGFQACIG
jgi:hypothetical protein